MHTADSESQRTDRPVVVQFVDRRMFHLLCWLVTQFYINDGLTRHLKENKTETQFNLFFLKISENNCQIFFYLAFGIN